MLRLKRLSEGVWCDFPKATGVRFKVRPIGQSEALRVASKARRKVLLDGKPVDDIDPHVVADGLFAHALEAWEGIEVEGAEADADVREALFSVDAVREFILERAAELDRGYQAQMEAELKNSGSSQGG